MQLTPRPFLTLWTSASRRKTRANRRVQPDSRALDTVHFGNAQGVSPGWGDIKRFLTLTDQTLAQTKVWEETPVPPQAGGQLSVAYKTRLSDGTTFTYALPEGLTLDPQSNVVVGYERLNWGLKPASLDHLAVAPVPVPMPVDGQEDAATLALKDRLFHKATELLGQAILFEETCSILSYDPDKSDRYQKQLVAEITDTRRQIPRTASSAIRKPKRWP